MQNNIISVSLQPKSLVNNSTTTITIATSLSLHNESALLNKICENMEKQGQKRVKCECQLLRSEPNWGGVERFTSSWLSVCVQSCHRNEQSASVQSTLLFLTSKPEYVCEKILYFTGNDREVWQTWDYQQRRVAGLFRQSMWGRHSRQTSEFTVYSFPWRCKVCSVVHFINWD